MPEASVLILCQALLGVRKRVFWACCPERDTNVNVGMSAASCNGPTRAWY